MKNTKKKLLFILLLGISSATKSQTITSARFRITDRQKGISSYELVIDNSIVVGINENSEIDYVESLSQEGIDYDASRNWGSNTNTFIGNYSGQYYSDFDGPEVRGKIKSIGNIEFKYNNSFDIHEEAGGLKSIGDIKITYYNTFDIHDPQGKVKSIGDVKITYFNKMDTDESKYGRIKSIKGNSKRVSVLYNSRHVDWKKN